MTHRRSTTRPSAAGMPPWPAPDRWRPRACVHATPRLVVPQHARQPLALAAGIALVAFAATLPCWGESSWMREFVEIACYFIFAMMWNLLAGYGGMVSIGQQAFFGFGGYVMLALGNFAGVNPFVAVPIAALAARRAWRCRCRGSRSACRAATSRSAPGSSPRCSGCRSPTSRRSAAARARALTALRGIERATRERTTLLDGARLRRRGDRAGLPVPAQQAGPRAARDPRQRGRRRVAGHRGAAHEARGLRRRRRSARGSRARCTSSATCASRPTPRSASTGPRSRSSWW